MNDMLKCYSVAAVRLLSHFALAKDLGETDVGGEPAHVSIRKLLILKDLVEAAGVEPASERAFNREPSCFFQFILSRHRRLERTKMRRRPA